MVRAIERRIAKLRAKLAEARRELDVARAQADLRKVRAEAELRRARKDRNRMLGEIGYWRCRVGGEYHNDVGPELGISGGQLAKLSWDALCERYWAHLGVEQAAMANAGLFQSEVALIVAMETQADRGAVNRALAVGELRPDDTLPTAIAVDFERARRAILAELTERA